MKIGNGILRVHLLALESRIQGRLPCDHPAFAWLVQHSSNVLTKSLVGKNGRALRSPFREGGGGRGA